MKRILSLLLSGLFLVSGALADTGKPNILLVMADDLGWTDLGCFGSEIETPHLDRLASRGVMFTDFHVSVSCSPTRSMLLSGNDNHIAGLGNMGELLSDNQRGKPGYEGYLNERVISLAEALRSGGYHTYMAGKWHLGHSEGRFPANRGFDRTFSLLVGGASHWGDRLGLLPADHPAPYTRNGKRLEELPTDFYSSRSYADFLMESIRENRGDGKPFFAYLAFTAPHDPVHAPEPWLSKYRGRYDEGYGVLKKQRWDAARKLGIVPADAELAAPHSLIKPWNTLDSGQRATEARGMEVYAGMLEAMDYHYGRVARFLEDIGEMDNTIVLFLSDNGPNPWYSAEYPGADDPEFLEEFDSSLNNLGHPGSNYAYGIGFGSASAGPLDKFKMTVGEGGIRSPLLVAGPRIRGGRKVDAFAYVTDIMPTLLELAGVAYPSRFEGREIEPMSGRSMKGLLDGRASSIYGADEFVGGEMGGGKWMRQGDLKAVFVPKPYGTGEWSLHNVVKDPGEARDLSDEMPKKLDELIAAWDAYSKEVGVIPAE